MLDSAFYLHLPLKYNNYSVERSGVGQSKKKLQTVIITVPLTEAFPESLSDSVSQGTPQCLR